MPRYKCHKEVWALKIKAIEQGTSPVEGGSWLLVPEEEGFAPVEVSHAWFEKHKPQACGYYVVYKDGYRSYSPAEAFEDGYSPA